MIREIRSLVRIRYESLILGNGKVNQRPLISYMGGDNVATFFSHTMVTVLILFPILVCMTIPLPKTRHDYKGQSPAKLSSLRANIPLLLGSGGTGSSRLRANSSCNMT